MTLPEAETIQTDIEAEREGYTLLWIVVFGFQALFWMIVGGAAAYAAFH